MLSLLFSWTPANIFILDPHQEIFYALEDEAWDNYCVSTTRQWAGDDGRYKGLSDNENVDG